MNEFHMADLKGCNYAMDIIMSHPTNIVSWTHTGGDYDSYDMNWLIKRKDGTHYTARVEGKDRTTNFKTGNPQYTYTYWTVMFNIEKYEELMKNWDEKGWGAYPVYEASYTDGVILYHLPKLPTEEIKETFKEAREGAAKGERINNKWVHWYWLPDTSINTKKYSWKPRLDLPKPDDKNKYGKMLMKK